MPLKTNVPEPHLLFSLKEKNNVNSLTGERVELTVCKREITKRREDGID